MNQYIVMNADCRYLGKIKVLEVVQLMYPTDSSQNLGLLGKTMILYGIIRINQY